MSIFNKAKYMGYQVQLANKKGGEELMIILSKIRP